MEEKLCYITQKEIDRVLEEAFKNLGDDVGFYPRNRLERRNKFRKVCQALLEPDDFKELWIFRINRLTMAVRELYKKRDIDLALSFVSRLYFLFF